MIQKNQFTEMQEEGRSAMDDFLKSSADLRNDVTLGLHGQPPSNGITAASPT
jgi:hypothetical protein